MWFHQGVPGGALGVVKFLGVFLEVLRNIYKKTRVGRLIGRFSWLVRCSYYRGFIYII